MDETTTMDDVTDDEFAGNLRDADEQPEMSQDRANRFYDRMRNNIRQYVEKKGSALGKTAEFLMLVPDVFILLWRLANDARVNGKNKVLLGTSIAYYLFPFDIIPEGIVGPMGFMDDLVFGVYVLNRMLGDTDVAIIRQHWSGSEDVLETIQRVLNAGDNLVGSDFLNKVKKMMAGRSRED